MKNCKEELENIINNYQLNIDSLNEQKRELEAKKENMTQGEYERELVKITNQIETEVLGKNKNEEQLNKYEKSLELIKKIKKINISIISNSKNPEKEKELSKEMDEKTTELIRIMTELPNEYADELRTILLTSENLEEITEEIMNEQPQETIKEEVTEVKEFEEEIVNIEEEKKQLEKVNKEYEESTTRMQQIYEEERDFFANNNLLTEEETKLKKEEYMTKKIAENINFIEAKNKKELLESKLGNIKKDGEEETNVEEEITEEVKINEFIPYTPEQSYLASEDISFRPIKTTRDKIEKMLEKISEYPIAIRQEQNKERNSNGQGIPEDMLKEEKTAENIEIELDEETIAEIKEEMNKKILLVNKEFKEELTSQKYLYSIVHNIEGEIVNISEQLQEYLQK